MELWVLGFLVNSEAREWTIQGVFDSKEKALAAVTDNRHLVGPITLNEDLGIAQAPWKGAYYPRLESGDKATLFKQMPKGTTGHCETCKWWHEVPMIAPRYHPPSYKECSREFTLNYLLKTCGSDVYGLFTAPNFGCVQWEVR